MENLTLINDLLEKGREETRGLWLAPSGHWSITSVRYRTRSSNRLGERRDLKVKSGVSFPAALDSENFRSESGRLPHT
ncbi:hypothetical protein J6590_077052 [Homalodisca vitripennis]|nr:hypothetical protein J6590_077052 [Homalodisca vitripennis]